MKPFLSIVIPTRNRAETLASCLEVCIEQTNEDYEIVVSDNNGSAETRLLIEQLAHPKIKYYRSDVSLPMHENWNRAVEYSSGEYVTVIGDDDGLIPSAVNVLKQIARAPNADIIAWPLAQYFWQSTGCGHSGLQDLLMMPLIPTVRATTITRLSGHRLLRDFARCGVGASEMPMIYTAAVHRRLIEKACQGGTPLFRSLAPDVYSGMLFAHLADEFIAINHPIGIRGTSRFSNFSEFLRKLGASEVEMEFFDLAKGGTVGWHPDIPKIPLGEAATYETLFTIQDVYPELKKLYPVNVRNMYLAFYRGLCSPHLEDEQVNWALSALVEKATVILGKKKVAICAEQAQYRPKAIEDPLGIHNQSLCVRGSRFGVTDIAAACRFLESMLSTESMKFCTQPYRLTRNERIKNFLPPAFHPMLQRLKSFGAR